jgi:hypothetical protein
MREGVKGRGGGGGEAVSGEAVYSVPYRLERQKERKKYTGRKERTKYNRVKKGRRIYIYIYR